MGASRWHCFWRTVNVSFELQVFPFTVSNQAHNKVPDHFRSYPFSTIASASDHQQANHQLQ